MVATLDAQKVPKHAWQKHIWVKKKTMEQFIHEKKTFK